MSERIQGTSEHLREKMLMRYGDGLHHKHNKNHRPYRMHYPSHPITNANSLKEFDLERDLSTGLIREYRLRKIRKRFDKGRFH